MRPVGMDYGQSTTQCSGAPGGPIAQNPPPCDPTKGPCTQPVDTAKCDPTKQVCGTQPCDPTKQNCAQPPAGGMPPLYMGTLDAAKAALSQSGNLIGVVQDSTGAYIRIEVNPATLVKDPVMQYVLVADKLGTNKYVFFADFSDKTKLAIRDNYPMAAMAPNQPGVNPPPQDSTVAGTNPSTGNPPPPTNPPPADTAKPPVYKGALSDLQNLLNQKNWKAVNPTPQGPIQVNLDNNSLKFDGTVTVAAEAGNAAHLYIFLGDKLDATKPALDPQGFPMVMPKPVTAGP
jgi:hypothetical protein